MKKVLFPVVLSLLLAAGCQKNEDIRLIETDTTIPVTPVSAVFSVNDTLQVRFSQGNLQYLNGTWRFAEHQTDCLPSFSENACDLFGWSTDISNWGINVSDKYDDYEGLFIDWGKNPDLIADLGEGWRTLTEDEWNYLFNERKFNGNSGEGYSFKGARINGQFGIIIFPDNYTRQNEIQGTIPDSCIFLPAVGSRIRNEILYRNDEQGWYWSSSSLPTQVASGFLFRGAYSYTTSLSITGWSRLIGSSVRLVRDI